MYKSCYAKLFRTIILEMIGTLKNLVKNYVAKYLGKATIFE